ncbi:Ribosomal protein S6 kinase alpha-5 [Eumeta japonica]|uniref:Ribosomal protein S6 kinase alpha-5 n=1 Tax=Eumeta variegata TaxID=151549 RepID=A0A4C1UIN0_EUMVA|nr:Ribosomal protein S6 kinase alpha-5 [Eumeta japonica]
MKNSAESVPTADLPRDEACGARPRPRRHVQGSVPRLGVRARATLDFDSSRVRARNRAPGPRREISSYYCSLYVAFNVIFSDFRKLPPFRRISAVDWWSVGVLTYELLTGASPFTVEGERNTHQEITKRILRCNYPVPPDVSPDIADFIAKLLVKDPRKRLGGGDGDAEELKRHTFFKRLDWAAVARREVPAPFVPQIAHAADTCNFADEFTRMPPTDSPAQAPKHHDKLFLGRVRVVCDRSRVPLLTPPFPRMVLGANELAHYQGISEHYRPWALTTPKERAMLYRPFAEEWDIRWRGSGGYSYVAPSIIFSENVISDEIWQKATGRTNDNLKGWNAKDSPFFQKYAVDVNTPILGDGSYSVCRKCIHRQTGREYAVKIISVQKKDIKQEVDLLRACQGCPYIVTLHEVFQDSEGTTIALDASQYRFAISQAFTYIVTELVSGGELASQLSRPLPERVALRLCAQLAHAVAHMHARGLVHRDIKPENILLTTPKLSEAKVKVVDFGFARRKPDAEERPRMMTPCFSLPYAREVLDCVRSSSAQGYDASCDLWSLGVIFYCMICGKPPFQPTSKKEPITAFMDRIREGTFNIEGPIWNGVTDHSKDLVRGLLSVDPLRRLTAEEVIAHLSTVDHDTGFKLADMTKADLYKRRNKNKTHKSINTDTSSLSNSSSSEPNKTPNDESKDALLETINNLKNRMNKQTSIENDLELIKAHTKDTPVSEEAEPDFKDPEIHEEVPPVKPVEKTYSKTKSKLDEYIYIESSQGLEGTKVAFPKATRPNLKKSKDQQTPVPRKRRKIDSQRSKHDESAPEETMNVGRKTRSKDNKVETARESNKKPVKNPKRKLNEIKSSSAKKVVKSQPASGAKTTGAAKKTRADKTNPSKESIENDKSAHGGRLTRKRRFEETLAKPVLREKGQNRTNKHNQTETKRETESSRTNKSKNEILEPPEQNFRVTRLRQRRNEVSLSTSQLKNIIPTFSFESDRRVNSVESNQSRSSNARSRQKSSNQKGYKSKAKPVPVRQSRNRRR